MSLPYYPVSTTEGGIQGAYSPTLWNRMIARINGYTPSGTFISPYTFIISCDGVDYYASNAFQVIYGGPSDAGGVDGADLEAVITAAIQDIDSAGGGCLFFVDYNFVITSTITGCSNLKITGSGATITSGDISVAVSGNYPVFHFETVENVEIYGLKFDLDISTSLVHAKEIFQFDQGKNINIHDNVMIDDSATGYGGILAIFVSSAVPGAYTDNENLKFVNNTFDTPNQPGGTALAHFGSCTNILVSENSMHGHDTFVWTQSCRDVTVTNNKIRGQLMIVDCPGDVIGLTITGNRQHLTDDYGALTPFGLFNTVHIWQAYAGYDNYNFLIKNNYIEGDNFADLAAVGILVEATQATGDFGSIIIEGNMFNAQEGHLDYGVALNVPEAQTDGEIIVRGNTFLGFASADAALQFVVHNKYVKVKDNPGYNPLGQIGADWIIVASAYLADYGGTGAIQADVVYTNIESPKIMYLSSGGAATTVKINGVQVYSGADYYAVHLNPGDTIQLVNQLPVTGIVLIQ